MKAADLLQQRTNERAKLIEALRESQAILDYRANQGDQAAAEQFAKNRALLIELDVTL